MKKFKRCAGRRRADYSAGDCQFSAVLISLKKPLSILEVGTAVGYSAIRMSEVMPAGASITTIEKYPPRIEEAKEILQEHREAATSRF